MMADFEHECNQKIFFFRFFNPLGLRHFFDIFERAIPVPKFHPSGQVFGFCWEIPAAGTSFWPKRCLFPLAHCRGMLSRPNKVYSAC